MSQKFSLVFLFFSHFHQIFGDLLFSSSSRISQVVMDPIVEALSFFSHNYVGRILSLSIWKLLRSVLEKYMCNMSALKYMCNMSALMVYNTESNAQR